MAKKLIKPKHPEYYTTNYEDYNINDLSLQQWQEIRQSLAKVANQRMRRIEKAKSKYTGEKYSTYGAIVQTKKYLEKRGHNRFDVKFDVREELNEHNRIVAIKSEILRLQYFLNSQTGTVTGYREIEKKRIETFKSGKYGSAKISDKPNKSISIAGSKDFYDFLSSDLFQKLRTIHPSEMVIEQYDRLRQTLSSDQATEILDKYYTKWQERSLTNEYASVVGFKATIDKIEDGLKQQSNMKQLSRFLKEEVDKLI